MLAGFGLPATAHAQTPQLISSITTPSLPGRPLWSDLSEAQQQSLMPLEPLWPTMSELHKRNWLALSQNYEQLPMEEKEILQSRMRAWAALTPRQRTRARLNYLGTQKQLKQDDKRALWEAYQALPEETKRKLAAQQVQPRVGAAPAVKPGSAVLISPPQVANTNKPTPRIASNNTDPATLLPAPLKASAITPPSSAENTEP